MGSASLAAARPPGPWQQYPSSPEGWGVTRWKFHLARRDEACWYCTCLGGAASVGLPNSRFDIFSPDRELTSSEVQTLIHSTNRDWLYMMEQSALQTWVSCSCDCDIRQCTLEWTSKTSLIFAVCCVAGFDVYWLVWVEATRQRQLLCYLVTVGPLPLAQRL